MNTNTESWGNIELPGLGDDELYKKNWNMSRKGITEYNESWKKSQKEGAQKNAKENKEWITKTFEKNKAIANDPIRTSKISKKINERMNDPIFRDWHNTQNFIHNAKKVSTPLGEFNSLNEAAKTHNISVNTLRGYIDKKVEGYFREEKNITRKTTGKSIMTPLGLFKSKKLAAEAYLKNGRTNASRWLDKWIKEDPENFFFIKDI